MSLFIFSMNNKNEIGQVIAIGGGGFGRNPNKPIIEEYILKLANTSKPKIGIHGQSTTPFINGLS